MLPELVAFLKNMQVGNSRIGELDGWMAQNEETPEAAASYFLNTYADHWKAWVPADVAAKVEASLQ